ncbi:MAG: hypothetical protein K940chlam3_01265 [Chlamydiae bacterium]|nr:hypothetical protein [Chlamydiota bacterium]
MSDKRIIIFGAGIIGFLVLFFLVFFAKQQIDRGFGESPEEEKYEKIVRTFANWKEFTSQLSKFRAYFPEVPLTDSKAIGVAGEDNVKAALNIFVAELPDQTALMVKVVRFPDDYQVKDVKFQLNETMNDILNAKNRNVLRNIGEVIWNGHKALNFSIQNLQIRIEAKSIFANNSIYTLVYVTQIDNFDDEVFENFLKNFALTEDSSK